MTISSISSQTSQHTATSTGSGFAALGQADFIKLMTTQMQMQDPFDPVDNKEMLAQMAQFSSLAGISDINGTLEDISSKLDAILSARASAQSTSNTTV